MVHIITQSVIVMVHIITQSVEMLGILKIWRDFAFTINREKRCFQFNINNLKRCTTAKVLIPLWTNKMEHFANNSTPKYCTMQLTGAKAVH